MEATMLRVLFAIVTLALAGGVNAQGNAEKARINVCNQKANDKHLKFDERQEFIKACVAGSEPRDVQRWSTRR
jgi:psiF repeat